MKGITLNRTLFTSACHQRLPRILGSALALIVWMALSACHSVQSGLDNWSLKENESRILETFNPGDPSDLEDFIRHFSLEADTRPAFSDRITRAPLETWRVKPPSGSTLIMEKMTFPSLIRRDDLPGQAVFYLYRHADRQVRDVILWVPGMAVSDTAFCLIKHFKGWRAATVFGGADDFGLHVQSVIYRNIGHALLGKASPHNPFSFRSLVSGIRSVCESRESTINKEFLALTAGNAARLIFPVKGRVSHYFLPFSISRPIRSRSRRPVLSPPPAKGVPLASTVMYASCSAPILYAGPFDQTDHETGR